MSNKHRAQVIETYPDGKAAVQFDSGRVECVMRLGVDTPKFFVGMRGMVDYVPGFNGYIWTFNPFKKQPKGSEQS